MEDPISIIKKHNDDSFQVEFGISPESADKVFSNPAMIQMLQHLRAGVMANFEAEDDISGYGLRLQGQARLLSAMIDIPNRLNDMKNS